MKKLFAQIIKFGAVGFLCFFIDYGIMVALVELAGFGELIASGCSFAVSRLFPDHLFYEIGRAHV